jgi:hypothetical protein
LSVSEDESLMLWKVYSPSKPDRFGTNSVWIILGKCRTFHRSWSNVSSCVMVLVRLQPLKTIKVQHTMFRTVHLSQAGLTCEGNINSVHTAIRNTCYHCSYPSPSRS